MRTVLLTLAFLILAACSAAPAAPTPGASLGAVTARPALAPTMTAGPTTVPSPTPVPTPAATPAGDERRPLLIWVVAPEPQRGPAAELIVELTRAMHIPAIVVAKSPDALVADVAAAPLAGLDLPDLVWGGADDLFLLQRAAVIAPADDGLDPADFLPATIAGASVAGERWGTPVAARGSLLLLYNRMLVEQAPRNTDELLAEARRLTGGGRYGFVAGWVESRWLEAWLRGFGGASVDAAGAPQLDTPAMIAALELLSSLRSAGPPPPSTYAEGAALFRDGRVAFAIDGDWSIAGYRSYSETLDLGIAPLPIVSATGKPALAPLEGVYLMYARGLADARLADARELGRILAGPTVQSRIAQRLGYLPALRSALGDPAITGEPALAAAAERAGQAPGIPPVLGLRCAWESGETGLPPLLLGEIEPPEAATRLQQLAERCVSGAE